LHQILQIVDIHLLHHHPMEEGEEEVVEAVHRLKTQMMEEREQMED
jgi:hypothetical protein